MDEIVDMLHARLRVAGKHCEVADQFKKLKTDQERVAFTLNAMQEYNIVSSTTAMSKNAKESEKLREQGNKVFVKGIFNNMTCIDALKLYTKSIAFAPYPSEQLALGYANRSAILFQLGLHSECIQDIDRALVLNYPDNLRAKLYLRKTECLMILGNRSVEDVLKEAQHWLDKMSLNDTNREKLKAKLDLLHDKAGQRELCASMDTEAKALEKQPPPLPIIESHNDEIPCASNAVAIKYNERYGRHVVATCNIRPGEIIAVEKPYSLLLDQQNMQTHCSNCLRVCWANIPCNYCTCAMYCSEECRNIEWKKCHDVECALVPALIEYAFYDFNFILRSIRIAVLALREAGGIEELRMMLKEVDDCDDPRTKGFSQDGKLHSDKYISVYSLATNTEKRSVSDLLKRALYASFILYCLATRTVIFGAKLLEDLSALAKNNDVTFFGGLILRHQQIIPNMHSLSEEQGLEHVRRGTAVMPFCSLINHSCDQNIFRQSTPNHIVIYATYPIRKGEQLLDNYGAHYAIMSRATRQQNLLKQYYFTCDCIPCQEDWPLYRELQSFETLVKRSNDKAKIIKALRMFCMYTTHLAKQGDVQDKPYIIEDLLKMVQVLHDCAPMPCIEKHDVLATLGRVYALNGNIFEIPQVSTYRK